MLTFVATARQDKSYEATATVRVEPVERSSPNDSFEASQRLSRSYAEIYTKGAVISQMARYMPNQRPPVTKELMAQQVKDLDLLEVSGLAADPRRAVAIANAGARALEDFSVRERLAPIAPATLPDGPSAPNVKMRLLLALVAGFVLSAGAALLLEALLQLIPPVDDIERVLDIPVLGVIPRLNLRAGPEALGGDAPRPGASSADTHEVKATSGSRTLPRRPSDRLSGKRS